MTTVVCGSSHFVDCETLVALGESPLLRVDVQPLRVTVVTPQTLPSGRIVHVVDNQVRPESGSAVRVVASERSVAIFWHETPVVIATALGAETVNVRADLRALGINLYDDADGLHVGKMNLSGSGFVGAKVALQLR